MQSKSQTILEDRFGRVVDYLNGSELSDSVGCAGAEVETFDVQLWHAISVHAEESGEAHDLW